MRKSARRRPARFRRLMVTAREGFTLVELTVVVAVIAVLIGLLAPSVKGIIERGRMSACGSNLHQMGVAQMKFASNQISQGRYLSGPFNVDANPIPNPECVWVNTGPPSPDYRDGGFRSHGVLVSRGLLRPEVMYCPSWDIETWLPGKGDKANGRCGWVTGVDNTKYWVLDKDNSVAPETAPGVKPVGGVIALSSVVSTYITRTTFIEPEVKTEGGTVVRASYIRPAQLGSDGEGQALMSEAFCRPFTADDGPASNVGKEYYYPVHEIGSSTNANGPTHTGVVGTTFMDNHVEMVNPVNKDGKNASEVFYEGYDWKNTTDSKLFYGLLEDFFNSYLSKQPQPTQQ